MYQNRAEPMLDPSREIAHGCAGAARVHHRNPEPAIKVMPRLRTIEDMCPLIDVHIAGDGHRAQGQPKLSLLCDEMGQGAIGAELGGGKVPGDRVENEIGTEVSTPALCREISPCLHLSGGNANRR